MLLVSMLVLSSLGIVAAMPADEEDTQRASITAKGKLYPDLIVSDIQWVNAYGSQFTSGSVTAGQPFQTKMTIRNVGTGAASQTFYVYLYVDGSLSRVGSVSSLAAGASTTITCSGMFCTGQASHSFRAVADATNTVVEKAKGGDAESNNERTEYLTTLLAEWTIAFYLDGDNNLEEWMIYNFLELAAIGSSSSMSLVVLMDRIPGYDTTYGDWTDTRVFFITSGLLPYSGSALAGWGELNVGNPATLIDFGEWAFDRFGSTKRALLLDDHGSLTGGICLDDTNDEDVITTQELGTALEGVSDHLADTIDLVGYDACLMGYTEVFYQSLGSVDYIVGSAQIGYAPGWPYLEIFSQLKASPTMSASSLASLSVQEYEDYWSPPGVFPFLNQHTLVAVDCGQLEALVDATSSFASILTSKLPDWGPEISNAKYNVVEFSFGPGIEWGADLYSYAYQVKAMVPDSAVQTSAQTLMNAITAAIVDYTFGIGYGTTDMRALGIMFPDDKDYLSEPAYAEYCQLEFAQDTYWDEFLLAFHSRPSYTRGLAAAVGDCTITLTWSAPSSNGGYTITDYHIYRGTVSGQLTRIASTGSASIRTWVDHNITSGVKYYYKVAAANVIGTGDFSIEVSATAADYVYLTVVVNTPGCPEPDEGVFPYVLGQTATRTTVSSYGWLGISYTFYGWMLDGQWYSYSLTVNVLMNANHTLEPVFYSEWDP